MAINGIEIEVGQKWRTRSGEVAELLIFDATDEYQPWRSSQGWHFADGAFNVRNMPEHDLIELVEHADGFKPWTGGEQPEETCGKLVEYRLRSGLHCEGEQAERLDWSHEDLSHDIVAYKVVAEVTQPAPDPLRVELIETPQDALDVQVGGDHYKSLAIQPVEYIHANKIGYFEGNVIKYVTRWRAKNGVADLEKAKHYIDLLIELEGGAK